ncbi:MULTISPECIES: NAD(P)H-dependent glycerol-3-phosphate dehydrogenase [unclassified Granulicatella]|uniref:NAD(P)H-dependent glycerol-3-phosphate dehydrogenase n=1 Tax=unclassified Granulicatella TaxID=2630493 RepID=UPI00107409E4|nr:MULTISPECIES: NAD(P)H-dependent glycerol-3-phosphate dehydrogenase [unclassified Granulicatella]MBF0779612.1 NAD(P)H-dependent glycerol-3-phosphate dehydrogenase [Granulicatella sp. 19428wC4_WM01]TFU96411.1 NAD(P)H-dependent glycerol-3-phosphate dehydrogenase [Granulicatella sp. WM01]
MKQNIAVLGAGSWGSALAMTLVENGHEVCLWGNHANVINHINEQHVNKHYLPHIVLPKRLKATLELEEALNKCDAILFAVPTSAIREVAQKVVSLLNHKPYIIHASKGLEQETHERISQILKTEFPASSYQDIIVLSGPSHAEEVARHDLTSITAACECEESAKYVQQLFMNHYFRVYTNTDVIGVELGAALKNVIAVGAGILHGLGYGDNAKAALVTRGLTELSRFGVACGAKASTFSGLSGVGDLIVTCTSVHSRNWRFGYLLGQGRSTQEALKDINMAVEGYWTTKVAYELAQEKGIDMPITTAIYDVLYQGQTPKSAVLSLMTRDGKSE